VITWSLGDRASKRLMYKIALELWAYFDAHAASSPELVPVRRFVGYDEGDEANFPMGVDTETIIYSLLVRESWRNRSGGDRLADLHVRSPDVVLGQRGV
jgi:hypothetical protein